MEKLNSSIKSTCGFSIIHFKARSLKKNFTDIVHCVANMQIKFDVIAIPKNGLESNDLDSYNITGYEVIHVVRDNKRGGGCLFMLII